MKEKTGALGRNPASLTGEQQALPFRDVGGEKLLQFIWQFGYYNPSQLTTVDGETVTVLFPGLLNKNGGPDFGQAKIRIGETTFFGNVELHLRTSDWERHQHQNDSRYNNVILHVVFQHDKKFEYPIPVVALASRVSTMLLDRYFDLMNTGGQIPCGPAIRTVKDLTWVAWKERLLAERLSRKAAPILAGVVDTHGHWEELLWWQLARGYGVKVNSDAFESVARSLPLTVLAKHKTSIHQIEALLFGQAGLLNEEFSDDYPQMLQREYRYLAKKLSLKPAAVQLQFLRMRPAAFPTIRLAQLATLIHQSVHLFSKIVATSDLSALKLLFDVPANDYWHYHYTFHQSSAYKPKRLGGDAIDNLVINTVVPVLFAYGQHHGKEEHKERAVQWLRELSAEKNSIIAGFRSLGLSVKTAHDTQALIELKNEYCRAKKCLQCAVGNALLKNEAIKARL